jgi:hypothetical protein
VTVPFRGSASGISAKRLRGPRYVCLGRDVYLLRGADVDLAARVEAARLVYPDGLPCLFTSGGPSADDGSRLRAAGLGARQPVH